jgi:hypothetical protein
MYSKKDSNYLKRQGLARIGIVSSSQPDIAPLIFHARRSIRLARVLIDTGSASKAITGIIFPRTFFNFAEVEAA